MVEDAGGDVSVLMHDREDRAWFERELEQIKKRLPEMPP